MRGNSSHDLKLQPAVVCHESENYDALNMMKMPFLFMKQDFLLLCITFSFNRVPPFNIQTATSNVHRWELSLQSDSIGLSVLFCQEL